MNKTIEKNKELIISSFKVNDKENDGKYQIGKMRSWTYYEYPNSEMQKNGQCTSSSDWWVYSKNDCNSKTAKNYFQVFLYLNYY